MLYTLYKLLTPHPLLNTHILKITVRRLPSITDLSVAFEIVDTLLLALDDISFPDGPPSPSEIATGSSPKETLLKVIKNAQEHPKSRQHQAHVFMFDQTTKNAYALPMTLMDVRTIPAFETSSPLKRKAMFGILGETENWEEMLKQRSKVSAVVKKEGIVSGVPKMTLREYERWKDGVRLSFYR